MQIYLTTNLINGRKYVGRDALDRPSYLGSGVLLKQAVAKYGKQNFKKEILEICSSRDEMCLREREWIVRLNAVDDPTFYNLSYKSGGMVSEISTLRKQRN